MSEFTPRLALVQDALPAQGGAERVLEAVSQLYPQAPIYTLVYRPEIFNGSPIENHPIHTSFINRLPGIRHFYRSYLPLFPLAIEQFDLRSYEIILSFSYAVAHGVLAQPDQLHISYTYTPIRQAWQGYHQFLADKGAGIRSLPLRWLLHSIRQWDFAAVARVDEMVATSHWAARCIWRAYRRHAEVIYPPVDVDRMVSQQRRESYYITIARMEAHKRVDLIVSAFTRLNLPLVVVGEGQLFGRIRKHAGPTVQMLGRQPDQEVADLLGRARAYVHAAEEDFGLTPVEAQAAGCPVIAFGRGGVRETVVEGETGFFYDLQSVESLMDAICLFEERVARFDRERIVAHAQRFSRERFLRELSHFVDCKRLEFAGKGRRDYGY